jgi:hypothetical protein
MGIWGQQVEKAGELDESRADLARAAGTGGAACQSKALAAGDATLALR